VEAGYGDVNSLRDASEVELGKLLPKRLVHRIQKSVKEINIHQKAAKEKWIVQDKNCEPASAILPSSLKSTSTTSAPHNLKPVSASSPTKTENCKPTFAIILEIDRHRSDRIIFMGEKIEVTATEFSLIHLLALHNEQVMSYDELIEELWEGENDVIYRRVNYHIFNIKKAILKTIGETNTNIEKIKKILMVVPGRGIMLNLMDEELMINRQYACASAS
jgi:helicase